MEYFPEHLGPYEVPHIDIEEQELARALEHARRDRRKKDMRDEIERLRGGKYT